MVKKKTRVSTFGEARSFAKSKAVELYSLAKAQEFQLLVKLVVSPRAAFFAF